MDVTETDQDVVIQRHSADLIADFDRSLGPFLRRRDGQLRRRVRARETFRLVSYVLEPFQELPQLLDPHLPKFLPTLAEAYLEHLQDHRRNRPLSTRSNLLEPLSSAICKIIYTFCKIRGEKVIVRFLNVETRYLELLLLAIEDAERHVDSSTAQATALPWNWHERYVVLLWLSQLLLAPFDLSTISSGDTDDADRPVVPGFEWPAEIPGITLRVIPLAIKYLASPGKERDGAKALLVRVAMRRDMQEIGILNALVQWAISTLRSQKEGVAGSPYYYIGSLAFLAGVLSASADTSNMDQYLRAIYYAVQPISLEDNDVFKVINGSALARKMIVKVIRSVIILVLRKPQQSMEDTEMVENSIGYMLERLADNDTPVRFAASKALSMITLKLDSDMAAEVVDAVLDSLNRNVLWVKSAASASGPPIRDLTAVDALEWHGLMLTLSHLLYRRSPPPESLSDIIHALLMGLNFEKRGTSGGSIGTNVRDAACFGIWALARRYTTSELVQVPVKSVAAVESQATPTSILQVIATGLVVAASLDPAGNIRRGSSAALQELIGRHPDTVEKGIAVVQTVDYHAVALRSRAIQEVALQATRLSPQYGLALLEALLGWRGVGDMDAAARRVAASTFGTLTAELSSMSTSGPASRFVEAVDLLLARISALQVRQVEERHGLLLCLASVYDFLPDVLKGDRAAAAVGVPTMRLTRYLAEAIKDGQTTSYRRPELIAEATAHLVVSSYPLLLSFLLSNSRDPPIGQEGMQKGESIVADGTAELLRSISTIDAAEAHRGSRLDILLMNTLEEAVSNWLDRTETEVVELSAWAALTLLLFSRSNERSRIVQTWIDKITHPAAPRKKHGDGYFHALTSAYRIAALLDGNTLSAMIITALKDRWHSDTDVETRAAMLRSLSGSDLLRQKSADLISLITEGLDDYTATARGDVGSYVRLEAIRATKTLWELFGDDRSDAPIKATTLSLFSRILRLAAEKLDRVRVEAKNVVALLLSNNNTEDFSRLSFSSQDYFSYLLDLCTPERFRAAISSCWHLSETDCMSSLLAGLATSADTGNEDLVIASRAALARFCERSSNGVPKVWCALIANLKLYQGQDRVAVPTLELVAYLFHVGLLQQHSHLNLQQLCLLTQRTCYKTGNIRKLEAGIKVYGGVASLGGILETAPHLPADVEAKRQDGIEEARKRLGALLIHPWPRIRTLVVDELWTLMPDQADNAQKLKSVDFGKADKTFIKQTVKELGLS